ncbi:MAG: PTS sugar transporter subunit IIA [Myxococcales bacterium]|jgi:PTS system mannose-specific IIA component|nr:PTS sugar transporter subunit IIA [Myxococcales bacterium]MDP3233129.1 PTS sugar transporter subunit IIA [Myxococcales bacterium]MDP3500410.1 PTS sugar transporter subunit IIA [Myxococcales bacterium]
MVGLVVASHGHLAEELVATARQIVGEVQHVATLSVEPGASPEEIRARIKEAVKSVDDGEGVLVFADLIGGSPCTQSLSLCQQARIEVVTGVNLPMLLKANSLRGQLPLLELAHQLAQYGQKNITCASDLLRARAPAA